MYLKIARQTTNYVDKRRAENSSKKNIAQGSILEKARQKKIPRSHECNKNGRRKNCLNVRSTLFAVFSFLLAFTTLSSTAFAGPFGLTVWHPAVQTTAGTFPENYTFNGTLNAFKANPSTFDAITTLDVLEHFQNPYMELKMMFL